MAKITGVEARVLVNHFVVSWRKKDMSFLKVESHTI